MQNSTPEPRPRVLVVDDEVDLVAVLRFGLEVEGFEVSVAYDGEAGLQLAQAESPDLVLLDLMLPKLDGYKVCRMLKFDERYRHIPIVILSARNGDEDRRLALEMGAESYITKPFELKEVVAQIRQKLRLSPRPQPEPDQGKSAA